MMDGLTRWSQHVNKSWHNLINSGKNSKCCYFVISTDKYGINFEYEYSRIHTNFDMSNSRTSQHRSYQDEYRLVTAL